VSKQRLLYVCSNHPAIRPGGMELYAVDLYHALRESEDFEPIFLARAGPPFAEPTGYHGWSPFAMVGDDPNQYLFYTNTFSDLSGWDPLYGKWANKQVLTRFVHDFLVAQKPDLVHFQHLAYLGYDIIRVTRNALPDVPLVCSLHDYGAICHRDGQMIRTKGNELCQEESPRRCHECFPAIAPQTFYLRKRFVQSHLSLVDRFIVPSEYVAERYSEWGIAESKIVVKPYSRQPLDVGSGTTAPEEPRSVRNRFGFFGQVNPYKGADVLLEAMEILGEDFDGELLIFGANLEIQPPDFRQRIQALLDGDANVSFPGPYERKDIPKLMASIDWVVVPSIWWETGPIVVWEAFQHGRPVICSDIGGMSEKVTDGVSGLHFRTRDPRDLADVMRRAAETPGLWEELHAGVPLEPAHSIEEDATIMTAIYKELLEGRSRANGRRTLEGAASA
jgi:glycosyltransferase involved in cell wall biosynthesis